jgi:hypothetical protein
LTYSKDEKALEAELIAKLSLQMFEKLLGDCWILFRMVILIWRTEEE